MPRGLLENPHAVPPGFMLLVMLFIGFIMSSMVVLFCASEKKKKTKKKKKSRSEANLGYVNGGEQKKSGDGNRDVWFAGAAGVAGGIVAATAITLAASEIGDNTNCGGCGGGSGGCGGGGSCGGGGCGGGGCGGGCGG